MNDTTRLRFRSDDTLQFFKFIFLIARLNALKRRVIRNFASVMLRDLTAYTSNDVMHTSVRSCCEEYKAAKMYGAISANRCQHRIRSIKNLG